MVLISGSKFGSKAQSINDLANRLTKMNWYEKAGEKDSQAEEKLHQFLQALHVNEYTIKWMEKDQVLAVLGELTFENSGVWEKLRHIPGELKQKIVQSGREPLLESAVNIVPQAVFHAAFERAFKEFGEEKVVGYLVGQAMYFTVLACLAELSDEADLKTGLLDFLESGHVPFGISGNTVYIL